MCTSSLDAEVCAASERLTPMSLFQYECDNESLNLQLRSANGYYLAQVRLWFSMQETINPELSLSRHTFSFPSVYGQIRLGKL